jgi:hypothetical protein
MEEPMFGVEELKPVRLTCVCRNPRCGLRKVSIPLDAHQRAHGVECDQCREPMVCVSVTSGRDPFGGETIWWSSADRRGDGMPAGEAIG